MVKRPNVSARLSSNPFVQGGTRAGAFGTNYILVNGQAFALPTPESRYYSRGRKPYYFKPRPKPVEAPQEEYAAPKDYKLAYDDPYVINSLADTVLNIEAKRRRYGDWVKIPYLGQLISTPLATVDFIIQSTLKPIFGQTADAVTAATATGENPILAGLTGMGRGLGDSAMNMLGNLSETLDVFANPIKGMFLEKEGPLTGFVRGVGYGDDGRHNYDWDTGNFLADLGLELISDPLNWVTLGGKAAATSGAKAVVSKAAADIGVDLSKNTTKRIAKNLTRKIIDPKNLDDVIKNADNLVKNAVGNPRLMSSIRSLLSKTDDVLGAVDAQRLTARIVERLTTETLTSLNRLTIGRNLYRASEGIQSMLLKGVLATSGLPLVGTHKLWKATRTALNTRALQNAQAAFVSNIRKPLELPKPKNLTEHLIESAVNKTRKVLAPLEDKLDKEFQTFLVGRKPISRKAVDARNLSINNILPTLQAYRQEVVALRRKLDFAYNLSTTTFARADQPRALRQYLNGLEKVQALADTAESLAKVEMRVASGRASKQLTSAFNRAADAFVDSFAAVNAARIADIRANYFTVFFNPHNGINSALPFRDLADEELLKLLKDFPEYTAAAVTVSDKTTTGFLVRKFKLNTVKDVALARRMNASILPVAAANKAIQMTTKYKISPAMRVLGALALPFKAGYLGSIGMLFRNLHSGLARNAASLDTPLALPKSIKHWFQTIKLYTNYSNVMQELTRRHPDEAIAFLSRTKLLDYYNKLPNRPLDPDLLYLIHQFIEHGPSGGQIEALRTQTAKIFEAAGSAKPQSKFDRALRRYTDTLMKAPVYSQLQSVNGHIEQTMRLSAYLQSLAGGRTSNRAMYDVIKMHFDYGDKSLAMWTTEVFFPFMSFTMRNIEYVADLVEKHPEYIGILTDVMRPIWDLDDAYNTSPYLSEHYDRRWNLEDELALKPVTPWATVSPSTQYHILAGNLRTDTGQYADYPGYNGEVEQRKVQQVFKLNPSSMDAISVLNDPVGVLSDRLLAPYSVPLYWAQRKFLDRDTTDDMYNSIAELVPYAGVLAQRYGLVPGATKSTQDKVKDSGNVYNYLASLFTTSYINEPKGVRAPTTPEERKEWLARRYYEYKTFGLKEEFNPYTLYEPTIKQRTRRRNQTFPRKGGFVGNYYSVRNKRWYTPSFHMFNSYRTRSRIHALARPKSIYRDLYTPSGVSRLKLEMMPTTAKNVKFRAASIRYKLRNKWSWYK